MPSTLEAVDKHLRTVLQAVRGWPFVVNGENVRRRVEGRVMISNVGAVGDAAVEGLGIATLAYWDVLPQLRDGALVEIQLDDGGYGTVVCLGCYSHAPVCSCQGEGFSADARSGYGRAVLERSVWILNGGFWPVSDRCSD